MHVVFRTDASYEVGIGHMMRCLTLANFLRSKGARCRFVCGTSSLDFIYLLQQLNFQVHLNSEPNSSVQNASGDGRMLLRTGGVARFDWMHDVCETRTHINGEKVDWLVVDHYEIDKCWEAEMKESCSQLLVIDDLANRPHECTMILDQNLGRKSIDYQELVPENCTSLIGPKYALLRPEFSDIREYSLSRRKHSGLKMLLVSMGGVDHQNITGQILEALKTCNLPEDCQIQVVLSEKAPWLAKVRDIASYMPWETNVISAGEGVMAHLMSESDLAIGAPGSTSWERCCVGLPSLLYILADNQKSVGKALEDVGAACVLGTDEIIPYKLKIQIEETGKQEVMSEMSRNASNLIDGRGTSRVGEHMGF